MKHIKNIVLLAHDTDAKDTTVAALPSIIQYYKEKGYQFLGIDDESYYVHHVYKISSHLTANSFFKSSNKIIFSFVYFS